ncbi:helicase-associated domain-containing protein [Yinghuangia seranimata]|uniref:helicase-associated domain-containing protein n=1 Tax=Yinghuangia seranimata TaxID=408067 RepID=UPI00248B4142|nr:helicase-associated domain-containing protein [Yinghuangia seranimata]MDI2131229.1 helicase-associated domain-containing protein [Yinghuangia seranimata]
MTTSTQRSAGGPAGVPDGAGVPRTLAEDLRSRTDAELAALLRARPDLTTPVPVDLTQLATRATTRASVARVLERLDRFTLQVVDAAVVLPEGFSYARLRELIGDDVPQLPGAVRALRERALLWGPDDGLHVVRTVRDLAGATPAGLGPALAVALAGTGPARLQDVLAGLGLPPTADAVGAIAALADLFGDHKALAALLEGAPPAAVEVLDKLVWGPPTGIVRGADRPVRADEANTPVEWLLARALLVPAGPQTVVLPREVGLTLRGGRVHRDLEPEPPALGIVERDAQIVDAAAAGAGFTAVRRIEDLLELWSLGGPAVLRAGGLGVRDLKRVAAQLDVTEAEAALWLELAYAAGLVAGDGEADERWLPTPAYDTWRGRPVAERWSVLAGVWLETTRVPGLVGTRDDKDRPVNAFGPGVDRTTAPEVRHALLGRLAGLPAGTAAPAADLLADLAWHRPVRTARLRSELVDRTLVEAELIGVTGRGALASAGRALLTGELARAADLLTPLLPTPLDHVLLQADLTAVAPGPLVLELAQELHLAADIESTGGATVYRFSESSVRRALDSGRTAADLHRLFTTHSRTPVPQPLTYLVDDVARRHGRLRVGAASAYLRCDDEAVLNELLADRRAHGLRMRRLAPTVLAAEGAPDAVLSTLRSLGYAPMAESSTGDVVVTRPDALRTPPRSLPPRVTGEPPAPGATLIDAAVTAIRAGDRAATSRQRGTGDDEAPGELPRTSAAETLLALQAAQADRRAVWIGYVTREGRATQRIIVPLGLEGGYVTAQEHTAGELHTYPLHRITGVAPVEVAEPADS